MTRISDHSVVYGRHMFKKKDDPLDIGGKTGQIAAAHEIGHWLREPGKALFDHIDRAKALKLPAGQQDDAQYGETLSAFSSLMGAGSVVGRYEATPWITRLRQHVLPAKVAWLYVHKLSYNPGPADVWAHQKRVLLAEKFLPKILQDAGG